MVASQAGSIVSNAIVYFFILLVQSELRQVCRRTEALIGCADASTPGWVGTNPPLTEGGCPQGQCKAPASTREEPKIFARVKRKSELSLHNRGARLATAQVLTYGHYAGEGFRVFLLFDKASPAFTESQLTESFGCPLRP